MSKKTLLDQGRISCHYSSAWFCCCCGWGNPRFKSDRGGILQDLFQINTHRLTESDIRFDVTLSRPRPWRHLMQKCCHLVNEREASAARLCSSVRQFLLSYSRSLLKARMNTYILCTCTSHCHCFLIIEKRTKMQLGTRWCAVRTFWRLVYSQTCYGQTGVMDFCLNQGVPLHVRRTAPLHPTRTGSCLGSNQSCTVALCLITRRTRRSSDALSGRRAISWPSLNQSPPSPLS